MIEEGIDLFWPMTSPISLHTTSFMFFMALTVSSSPSSSELSLMITSALKSIMCSPMDLPTETTSSRSNSSCAIASVAPPPVKIRQVYAPKSQVCQVETIRMLQIRPFEMAGLPSFVDRDSGSYRSAPRRFYLMNQPMTTRTTITMMIVASNPSPGLFLPSECHTACDLT
jgi:hypothetical protein